MKTWRKSAAVATAAVAVALAWSLNPTQADALSLGDLVDMARKQAEAAARAGVPIRQEEGAGAVERAPASAGGVPASNRVEPAMDDSVFNNGTDVQFNGFPSAHPELVPKGNIVILDAAELLKRAGADMAAMQKRSEKAAYAGFDCMNGADPRDPKNNALLTKCLESTKEQKEEQLGIYAARTIGPERLLISARFVAGVNERGDPVASKAPKGVVTTRVAGTNGDPHPEDASAGWATVVDTSVVGPGKKVPLPPGSKITSYDEYVKMLKQLAAKYPAEDYSVEMRPGFDQNDKAYSPDEVRSGDFISHPQTPAPKDR